jgi:hypothetical protein
MSEEQEPVVMEPTVPAKQTPATTGGVMVRLRPFLGIGAGILVAAAGTALWIVLGRKYQISWMAAFIAFGAASAIKYVSKGTRFWYGIAGGLIALCAALTANLFTAMFLISQRYEKPVGEIIGQLDIGTAASYISALARPVDYLLYFATVVIGFWFSFTRKVTAPQP